MFKCPSWFIALSLGAVTAFAVPTSSWAINFFSWEVASEFSDSSNPNDNLTGPFSYGYETGLNVSPFTTMTVAYNQFPNITGWQRTSDINDLPVISHNVTDVTQGPFGSAHVVFPPHALSLHPGKNCEYADLRFTAPKVGNYRIRGRFYAMNYNAGTSTDVHVSVNGQSLYDGQISFPTVASASFTPSNLIKNLQIGDTIDFQVGCGGNGDYFSDSTGLDAVIER